MAKIVTSARGEKVDFDLISIKNSMAAVPLNDNVKKRERFINKKRRRGIKRKVDEMAQSKRLEDANFAAAVATDKQKNTQVLSDDNSETENKKPRRKIGQ